MALQYIWDRSRTKCYIYAYKGGPRIHVHEGKRKPKVLPPAAHRALAEALEARAAEPQHILLHVIREWQRSKDWEALAESTRKTWRSHIRLIEDRWGEYPYSVWNDPRMAAKVVKWRDERSGRAADIGVSVLRALLKWAWLNGYVSMNVAQGIPQIAKTKSRAEIIWTQEDIAAFEAAADGQQHIIDGLRLAALTGLRRADLVSLTFEHVGEFAVSKTALKKSRGRRRKAVIPMTAPLEALLTELRQRPRQDGVNTVLVNSFGRSWSDDGFGGSFNRVRDAAGIVHVDDDGIRRKRLHDVRGTFCTLLIAECGLTDEQAARIMGWSPATVGNIRQVYVDDARVVVAIGQRIAKHGAKQP